MQNNKTLWTLVLILIIASFLRLYHITSLPPGLYPDEAMNGNNALEAIRTDPPDGGYKVYYPENNGREGLFINIQAFFLKTLIPLVGHPKPWILRVPSALFGVLTVLGIYFLGKELFSTKVGLLSSFLLATSFWHIMFSRIGFRAIMAPMLLVWSIYFLLSSIRAEPNRLRRDAITAVLGGLLYGLGFYTYIAYRVSPILLLLFIPFFRHYKNFWKIAAIFLATTFITALPIGIYYLNHPADFLGRTSQISIVSSETPLKDFGVNVVKTLGMFHVAGDWNWRHNYAGRPQLFWPVGMLLLVGIAVAVRAFIKNLKRETQNPKFGFLLLFLWLILMMIPVVISSEGLPHALRAILLIPPTIILGGVGGMWVYEFLRYRLPPSFLKALAVIFLVLLLSEAYRTYFIRWAKSEHTPGAFAAKYANLGKTLHRLPTDLPKYVVVKARGVDVRGIPMPAQTVMFITDTFLPEEQALKNIHYVRPEEEDFLPPPAMKFYIE